jgi:hypothetical protein
MSAFFSFQTDRSKSAPARDLISTPQRAKPEFPPRTSPILLNFRLLFEGDGSVVIINIPWRLSRS